MLWIAFESLARAETLAETVEQWGLLGSWAVDCAVRPDRDKGALLTYEIRMDGRVMYRRNFGEAKDENEVVSATVNADGLLNVMVYFPSLQQTREFGLLLSEQGACAQSTIAASTRSGTANTSRPARRHLRSSAAISDRSDPEYPFRILFPLLRNVRAYAPFSVALRWRKTS